MKIVHVSYARPHPRYSNPWAWIKFLGFFTGVLEALAGYADVISIYHINYKGVIQYKGVHYHFTGFNKLQLLLPARLNRYVRKLNPDVVMVHGLIFPWQVLMLRWELGPDVPIIAQHHAERPVRLVRKFFQRFADRYIKVYLFTSPWLGLPWVENGLIGDIKKIKPVMEASSVFSPMRKEVATQHTGVSGTTVYLWVGRLDANKDPLTVVRSFIRFVAVSQGTRLYMIFQTDELLNEIKHVLSATAGASQFISLVGKTKHEDMQHWYNSADFIVSGSHYEGSGIAVCEAMSCGCIPLLTDIPSFRMMTDNGQIGLLYDAGNEEALFRVLVKSLTFDRENEKRKVIDWFRQELSFEAIARKTMDVINEVKQIV